MNMICNSQCIKNKILQEKQKPTVSGDDGQDGVLAVRHVELELEQEDGL